MVMEDILVVIEELSDASEAENPAPSGMPLKSVAETVD
jgi:hypothetical protein